MRMDEGNCRVLRQRNCRAERCGALFWICSSCDRGQRYCGDVCRQNTRRQQRRAANRRHQQSCEGRLDHRDRQRAYRQRQLQTCVTDQSSLATEVFVRMPCRRAIPSIMITESVLRKDTDGRFPFRGAAVTNAGPYSLQRTKHLKNGTPSFLTLHPSRPCWTG